MTDWPNLNGRYNRRDDLLCNGRPSYSLANYSLVILFQPPGRSCWTIGLTHGPCELETGVMQFL